MEVDMIRKHLFWGAEEDGDPADEVDPQIVEQPSTKTMTAEEIEKMTARAADRASRKARKDLASELGFDDLNAMKDFVGAQQEATKEAMDEQTKAIQGAKESQREYEALKSNLASDRLDVAVQAQVLAAGADPKKVSRVAALVRTELDPDVVNEEDTWGEVITDALSSVKEDIPELFAGTKGFGSGDGGAKGKSAPPEDEDAALKEKFSKQFAAKGLITHDPTSY
jgi:hypothetical protein